MQHESWIVTGPQIIEVDDVHSVRVGLVGGRIDVVGRDEPGARVEVHRVDGRPLEVSLEDGELRVGYSITLGGWEGFLEKVRTVRDKDQADVHIAVPHDVAVRLGTVSAEGLLAAVTRDCDVSTVTGTLVTDSTRGTLAGNTVSGEIIVRDHVGDLRLTTVSGDLTASGELGRVWATSVSGDVALDVSGRTSSITATGVSGGVTVRLPADRGLIVEARTASGRVVVDGRIHRPVRPGAATTVDLRTGGEGCHVSANTVSGHVTVLRGAPTPAHPADGWSEEATR